MRGRQIATLLFALLTPTLADYLGPRYPPPTDLTTNESRIAKAWDQLTSTFDACLSGSGNSKQCAAFSGLRNVTFSLGAFSVHDPAAASSLQFHHTSPEVANARNGTKKVDGNSVYRIASVTKLFTVLAGLLNVESADWDRPLSKIFPQLSEAAQKAAADSMSFIQWDNVTPRNLAAQIAGVPRDGYPLNIGEVKLQESIGLVNASEILALGLPPLDKDAAWAARPCVDATDPACPRTIEQYLPGIRDRPPTFEPYTSPGYANNGFVLLGQALENITGKSLEQLYTDSIFDPLSMTNTHSTIRTLPNLSTSVIPGNALGFLADGDLARSSGGLMSSTLDLAKLGTGILNYTLLSPYETHKWMKPISHTARLEGSVGAPWEILRYTHPATGVVTDLYPKSGDSGDYSSWIVLIPDFGAGFTVLTAGTSEERLTVAAALADAVTETFLPALMGQAAVEAEGKFAGTYRSAMAGLNSSLTLAINHTKAAAPGLAITRFISNGTDVLANALLGEAPLRLVPTILNTHAGKIAFRAISQTDAPHAAALGLFSRFVTSDWVSVGATTYGNLDLPLFIFDVDGEGRGRVVGAVAFRVEMERVGG